MANSVFIPFTENNKRAEDWAWGDFNVLPIFSRLLEFSWMLSMAFVRVTSFEEEEESAFELLSSFSEQQIGFLNDFTFTTISFHCILTDFVCDLLDTLLLS